MSEKMMSGISQSSDADDRMSGETGILDVGQMRRERCVKEDTIPDVKHNVSGLTSRKECIPNAYSMRRPHDVENKATLNTEYPLFLTPFLMGRRGCIGYPAVVIASVVEIIQKMVVMDVPEVEDVENDHINVLEIVVSHQVDDHIEDDTLCRTDVYPTIVERLIVRHVTDDFIDNVDEHLSHASDDEL
ncbi:uncharacterized protein E5676_scaffold1333G00100 [Cucumis melo var. makuwa]|uniref:Uncharacterized protein n=1 Tax=Cucumis melo var. makuwa TaxID=1194695 RepID=A0A5D3BM06_CUCMM|nr:uncharacterized protein E5676_scaffold1333G00100 [Cucumis melo var. makuwa]